MLPKHLFLHFKIWTENLRGGSKFDVHFVTCECVLYIYAMYLLVLMVVVIVEKKLINAA